MLAGLKLEVPVRRGYSVVDVFQVQSGKSGHEWARANVIANGLQSVVTGRVLQSNGLVAHELGGQLSPANLDEALWHLPDRCLLDD
jgi:hypothetical protein